jgi:hypothetical protein
MNATQTLAPIALALLLAACSADAPPTGAPAADAATADATAPAADAATTEAVYGNEAPVAIEAAPVDDHGHAHDEGEDHDHADGDHAH